MPHLNLNIGLPTTPSCGLAPCEHEEQQERLLRQLGRDRTQAEPRIRWGLEGGLDPHEICSELDEVFERLLWSATQEVGWKHSFADELPF